MTATNERSRAASYGSLRQVEILVTEECLTPAESGELHLSTFTDKSIFPHLEGISLLDHHYPTVPVSLRVGTTETYHYVRGWRDKLRASGIAFLGCDGYSVISDGEDRWGG